MTTTSVRSALHQDAVTLLCGDARAVLRDLPDASVDAVCTDPPYALTDRKDGERGFMGSQWDNGKVAHDPAFWAEVLRVAKPGAFLVAFGGTRTAHRLACAIEDAGWEIRDTVYLLWCHGQGFPKSLDVSKAIDKMAGAERDVVGVRPDFAARANKVRRGVSWADATLADGSFSHPEKIGVLTAPATDAAKEWDGWGTALKPAAEPIVLARKPLSEPTVAANVLRHGTGALHIDACRVPTGCADETIRHGSGGFGSAFMDDGWRAPERHSNGGHQGGRWPSNLVLSHIGGPDGCQPAGARRVRGDVRGRGRPRGTFPHSDDAWGNGHLAYTGAQTATGQAHEEMQAWSCHPSCPVRLLDEQAGPRTSGGYPPAGGQRSRVATYGQPNARGEQRFTASTGSASRFFPTFAPDPADAVPWRYVPKASRAERNRGLEGLPVAGSRPLGLSQWAGQTNGSGETMGPSAPQANGHPCVKPVTLARWLARLVCPPQGTILDPFAGSGSLGVGALLEGFRYIGIEMDPSYVAIAQARIAQAQAERDRAAAQPALPLALAGE